MKYDRTIHVRIDERLYQLLSRYCEGRQNTISDTIREYIKKITME